MSLSINSPVALHRRANEPDAPSTTQPLLCLHDTPSSGRKHRAGEQTLNSLLLGLYVIKVIHLCFYLHVLNSLSLSQLIKSKWGLSIQPVKLWMMFCVCVYGFSFSDLCVSFILMYCLDFLRKVFCKMFFSDVLGILKCSTQWTLLSFCRLSPILTNVQHSQTIFSCQASEDIF